MRVFVAGATGVLGRRAVAALVAAGHEVTGARAIAGEGRARSSRSARTPVRGRACSTPTRCAPRSPGTTRCATSRRTIPPLAQMPRDPRAWDENDAHPPRGVGQSRRRRARGGCDRVRAGVARVPVRRPWRRMGRRRDHADRSTTAFSDPVAAAEANATRFAAAGGRGVVLRFGMFYAPDSDQSRHDGEQRAPGCARSIPVTPTATSR